MTNDPVRTCNLSALVVITTASAASTTTSTTSTTLPQQQPAPEKDTEWIRSHLSLRELVTAAKEGVRIGEQRLNLLDEGFDGFLGDRVSLRVDLGRVEAKYHRVDLGDVRVNKPGNLRAAERAARRVGRREQVRRIGVGQELRDDGGLNDNLAVVRQRGNQPARVDLEVFGRARRVQVDRDLLKRELELLQDDVRPVRPWAGQSLLS